MTERLDNYLSRVNRNVLDNPRIALEVVRTYVRGMTAPDLRTRIKAAMSAQGMSKAELSRRSGVPYHGLDKFLKGASLTTSAENAQALARALGISLDGEAEYEELRKLFFQLGEEQREFLLASVRGLLSASKP